MNLLGFSFGKTPPHDKVVLQEALHCNAPWLQVVEIFSYFFRHCPSTMQGCGFASLWSLAGMEDAILCIHSQAKKHKTFVKIVSGTFEVGYGEMCQEEKSWQRRGLVEVAPELLTPLDSKPPNSSGSQHISTYLPLKFQLESGPKMPQVELNMTSDICSSQPHAAHCWCGRYRAPMDTDCLACGHLYRARFWFISKQCGVPRIGFIVSISLCKDANLFDDFMSFYFRDLPDDIRSIKPYHT